MKLPNFIAILIALSSSSGDFAAASEMYSASGMQGIGLHSIDQSNGEPTRIMNLPFVVSDLASSGQPDNPYVWSVVSNQLAKVRPATQEVVSVVALEAPIQAIAIDPTSSTFYGVDGTQLYEVSANTGQLTAIGNLTPSVSIVSLTFDLDGRLYGLGRSALYTISTSDASVSVINDMLSVSSLRAGIAVRPEDGTMFLVSNSISDGYKLFTVDTLDGTLTEVGDTLGRPMGLAFAVVPEPTAVSLLFTLAILGFSLRRPFKLSRF